MARNCVRARNIKPINMKIKKILFGILFAAIVITGLPQTAKAATTAELIAEIQSLQAQLNQLLAQLMGGAVTPPSGVPAACAGISFTRNLSIGSTGNDVRCLQAFLNQNADTRVALSGAGSSGLETFYFGTLTRSAVIRFQNKHAATILARAGYFDASGFFGAATRATANNILYPPATGGTPGPVTGGTEGTLAVSLNPTPASGTRIYEGDMDVAIMSFNVRATGSDIDIQRIRFSFGTQRPYDFISRLRVYDGGNLLGSIMVDSTTVDRQSGIYSITIAGLHDKVSQNTTRTLTVRADVQNAVIRDYTLPANLTVSISANGIRGLDTALINQYAPSDATSVSRTFSVNAAQTSEAGFVLSRDISTPLARNIASGGDRELNDVTMLVFAIRAQKDNITITDINNVTFSGADGTTAVYPDTAYLTDSNGVILASASVGSDNTADFSGMQIAINQDATKIFTVKADYSNLSNPADVSHQNTSIAAVMSVSSIVAENSQGRDIADSKKRGGARGYTAYLYQAAPVFTLMNASATRTPRTSSSPTTYNASFTVRVTASGGDIAFARTGAFAVKRIQNHDIVTATTNGVSSTYDQPTGVQVSGNQYIVSQDTSAVFNISARIDTGVWNGLPDFYDLRITQIDWSTVIGNTTFNNATTYTVESFKTESAALP